MSSSTYVLVTGANGGLGLGICLRLIDDFLVLHPKSSSLTLILTTRSRRKGDDTRRTLLSHLENKPDSSARQRIHLQPENVELTNLLSVRALARTLVQSKITKLDAIILNAGMAGWSGLDWLTAFKDIVINIRTNTTWPAFKLGIVGLVAPPQFASAGSEEQYVPDDPPLGQIFCANVFGHYMLTHWLMPLLQACDSAEPGKIIWVSSIEPQARHLNEQDLQAFESNAAYEHTKRLTDVLALNYDRQTSSTTVTSFKKSTPGTAASDIPARPTLSFPSMHVTHPGVCPTSIISLYWIIHQFYILGILLARLAGSPWATLSTYTAAMVMSWVALTPTSEIQRQEAKFGVYKDSKQRETSGRVKWGTAVTRLGSPTVRPTEVEGWGLNGSGDTVAEYWWAGKLGRAPGAKDATREDVGRLEELGGRVWKRMEELRAEWEGRIEAFENAQERKK